MRTPFGYLMGRLGVLFSQLGHASGTIFEYPIVADIDNDDSAEIASLATTFV